MLLPLMKTLQGRCMILSSIILKPPMGETLDKAWWTGINTSIFTTKSDFNVVRSKKQQEDWCKFIWNRWVPNKIPLFMWKVLQGRIPTDDNLKRCRIYIVSKCCRCSTGCEETTNHLFLTIPTTKSCGNIFFHVVGFKVEEGHLRTILHRWWITMESNRPKDILISIPSILCRSYGKEGMLLSIKSWSHTLFY